MRRCPISSENTELLIFSPSSLFFAQSKNVLIGMDTPLFANRRVTAAEFSNSESGFSDGIPFIDDYFEAEDSEMFDIPTGWGMPDGFSWVHPIYFSKCLTKGFILSRSI